MDHNNKRESTLLPVSFSVNPQVLVSLIQNIGSARINGAELEVNAVIARGLTSNLNYT